jgi:hypothetical protein
MDSVSQDIRMAVDRVAFAEAAGVVPDQWQRDLLRSTSSRILLNVARQSGKSLMAAIIALHRALYYPGSLILILAPAERQAKETFSKVASAYRALGYDVGAESYRKLGMELTGGSRIEALPGSEKTIRGFSDVDLLIIDEAARVDDDLYKSARPMLAVSGGTLMMLSTPFGKRGVFYHEWDEGVGWERYTVTAEECPRISDEFLEAERESLGHWWFAQEYECTFMEAVDSVFSSELIQAALSDDVRPLFEEVS